MYIAICVRLLFRECLRFHRMILKIDGAATHNIYYGAEHFSLSSAGLLQAMNWFEFAEHLLY